MAAPGWLSGSSRQRYGNDDPSVALLSIGEESTKGNPLVKETHELFANGVGIRFVGNVEGRDLLTGQADIVVTDGFTGNVALKALEGALRTFMGILGTAINSTPETKAAGDVLIPALLPYAERCRSGVDRRRDAARRRRRLHHQSRQFVGAGSPTRCRSPSRWPRPISLVTFVRRSADRLFPR